MASDAKNVDVGVQIRKRKRNRNDLAVVILLGILRSVKTQQQTWVFEPY